MHNVGNHHIKEVMEQHSSCKLPQLGDFASQSSRLFTANLAGGLRRLTLMQCNIPVPSKSTP